MHHSKVTLWVKQDQIEAVKEAAKRYNLTTSATIRVILDYWAKDNPNRELFREKDAIILGSPYGVVHSKNNIKEPSC